MVKTASFKDRFVGLLLLVFFMLSGCSIKLLSSEEVKGIAKELGIEKKEEKKELFKELAHEAGRGFGVTSPVDSAEAGRGMAEVLIGRREVLPIVVEKKDKPLWEWVGYQRIKEKNYSEAEQIFKVIGEKRTLAKLVLIYLDSGNSFQADKLLRYLKKLGYQFEAQEIYQEIVDQGLYQFTLPLDHFFKEDPVSP